MIVRIDYPEPSVRLDLWGGTCGTFAGLDQFNRIIDQRWQNNASTTPTDIDRYQYGYDQNSNRLWKANIVGTPVVTGGLDEYYTYDPLNRLTDMQRGVLNGTKTGITGTPSVEQDWTLDPTGNWSGFVTMASGTTNLNQTRTSNPVNEITDITESTGPTWVTPAYDAAGNTTTMPKVSDPTQSFTAVYDPWNRMVSISDTSGTVATYAYDGRNRRIVKTTSSETRHFYFTDQWQDVEERIGASVSADNQYAWGIRYVDEMVCRDDTTARLYACQDANFNATSITDTSGNVLERYLFDPYGDRIVMNASWSIISSSEFDWIIGHQGLLQDEGSGLLYDRYRLVDQTLGRFTQRDNQGGYADGMSLYEYEGSRSVTVLDPYGIWKQVGSTTDARSTWECQRGDNLAGLPQKVNLSGNLAEINNWLQGGTVKFKVGGTAQTGSLSQKDLGKELCPGQKLTAPNVWIAANLLQAPGSIINIGGGVGIAIGTDLFTPNKKIVKVTTFNDLLNAVNSNSGDIWGIVIFGHGGTNGYLGDNNGHSGNQLKIIDALQTQKFRLSKAYAMQCNSFAHGTKGDAGPNGAPPDPINWQAEWQSVAIYAYGYGGLNILGFGGTGARCR